MLQAGHEWTTMHMSNGYCSTVETARARAASHRPRNSLPAVRPRPPAHVTQHKDRRHAAACTLPSGPITSFLFPPLNRRIEPGLPVVPVALENRLRSLLPTDVPFPFMLLAMLAEELDSFDERGGVLVWEGGEKCAELALRPIVEGAPRLLDEGGLCDNASWLASGVEVTAEGARASGVSLDLSPPCGVAGAGAGDAPRPACDPFPRESPERESASDGGLSSVEGEGPASVVAAAAGFRRPCARASSMSMLSLLPAWPSTSNSPSGVPCAPGYLNETRPLVQTVSDDKEHCRIERSEPHQSLSASMNRDTAAEGLPLPLPLPLSLSLSLCARAAGGAACLSHSLPDNVAYPVVRPSAPDVRVEGQVLRAQLFGEQVALRVRLGVVRGCGHPLARDVLEARS